MLRKIHSSLQWKLISLIVLIIMVMMTLVGLFSYYDTSRTIRRDVEHFSAQVLHQANLNLNRQYQEYEQGFLVLGTSYEFKQWLRVSPEDRFELISGYQSIEMNYMRAFLVRHPEILSISMLSDKGGEFTYSLGVGVSKEYKLSREPWLNEVDRRDAIDKRIVTSEAYVDELGYPMPLHLLTLTSRFGQSDAMGYLKMDISLEPAQSILNEMELGEGGMGVIAMPDGGVLVRQGSKDEGPSALDPDTVKHLSAESGSFLSADKEKLIVFETIPYTGWKTVAIISNRDVAGSINRVRFVTIVVTSAGILAASILIAWVAASITRRLTQLRAYMKIARAGNLQRRIDVTGTDEVADLSQAFNRMMEELDDSIAALTETKLMQQKAVLSAMQSQIHSHFLYNALESINSMAHLAGHGDIERTAISLSRMLRYTSNYRDTVVRLEEEVDHVIHYLNICRIRFGEAVSFSIDLPDECKQAQCLKAVLQPIAENAIKHGIESTGEPTRLNVTIRREEETIVAIFEDNGAAIDAGRIEAFRQRLAHPGEPPETMPTLGHVGLLNVHYRLLTYYQMTGAGIGVSLDMNSKLGGVRVTVRFPGRRAIPGQGKAGLP